MLFFLPLLFNFSASADNRALYLYSNLISLSQSDKQDM